MKNQNLNVSIDLSILRDAIKNGSVTPRRYTDKHGVEHVTVTLLVTEARNQSDNRTHTVRLKADDSWNGARDKRGDTIYVGDAKPSKYQPEDNDGGQQSQAQSSDNPIDDIF